MTTGARVGAGIALVALIVAASFAARSAVSALRARTRREACVPRVERAFAPAGARARHISAFVCDELSADDVHAVLTDAGDQRWLDIQREGLLRVDASGVLELLSIRRAQMRVSAEACAAQWTGDEAVMVAVGGLTDPDLRRFARVLAMNVLASRSGRAPAFAAEDAEPRFLGFVDELSCDGEAAALEAAWAAPGDTTLACAAAETLLDTIATLPPAEGADVARAMFVRELTLAPSDVP